MKNNLFPTLTQIAPDRWEGDSRIIQVRFRDGIYFTSVGTRNYALRKPEMVRKLIESVPPVTGNYSKLPADSSSKWQAHGMGIERSLPVARSTKSGYKWTET